MPRSLELERHSLLRPLDLDFGIGEKVTSSTMTIRNRALSRLATLAIILMLAFFSSSPSCLACSCVEEINPASFIHETEASFVGRVVSAEPARWNLLRGWDSASEVIYLIAVDKEAKGTFASTVKVRSPADALSCGINLEPGDRRAFFLSERDITGAYKWNTNTCAVMPVDALNDVQPVQGGPQVGDGETLRTLVEQFRIAEALVVLNLEVLIWSIVRGFRERRSRRRLRA